MKKEEYLKLSKEEIVKLLLIRDMTIKKQSLNLILVRAKDKIIMRRVLKIRNSLDYLLEHPFSMDNNFQTPMHLRDRRRKVKYAPNKNGN